MSRRCIAGLLTGAALGAEGARISRKGGSSSIASKDLAGVPLLNYDLAYGGQAAKKHDKEHWVVVAKPDVSTAKLEELCASVKECEAVGHPSEGGVPYFKINSTEQELEQVLALAPGQMEFVEPDGMFHLDPEENVLGAASSGSWGLGSVGVPTTFGNSGEGVHIYVLDTGIRWTHTEFGGRATAAFDSSRWFWQNFECNNEENCGNDKQGHGTHCAGTAGGETFGIATKALIYAGKVLSDQGSGQWSWTTKGLDWLATNNLVKRPAIASMSLGGPGTSATMKNAVDKAVDSGVTVVVASGNSNSDACSFSPAFVASALSVGSTDSSDRRSVFSNYGSCVQIWAPGTAITSAGVDNDDQSATYSGTSMACPHVAGGAALVLAAATDPVTPEQVAAVLVERAKKDAITDLKDDDVNYFLWVGDA